jgi:acyl-CoA hydrolase
MSWIDQYRSKLVTAQEAVSCVESGMRVYIHPGCAEPEALVEALMGRAAFVNDVEVMHLLTMGASPYCVPEMAAHFRHNALFVGGNVREAVNDGRADYTPIFLGEVEALFESGEMPIDVAARFPRLLQLWRGRGLHPDRREIRPPCGCPGERSNASHLRRQLHPRQ